MFLDPMYLDRTWIPYEVPRFSHRGLALSDNESRFHVPRLIQVRIGPMITRAAAFDVYYASIDWKACERNS